MTETVILTIIGGVVTLLTALIGKLYFDASRTKQDDKAAAKDAKSAASDSKAAARDKKNARVQVKNSHDPNLREEQDERHDASRALLKVLGRDVRGLREDHYATRKDIGLPHAEDRAERRETQELRRGFAEHPAQTAGLMPSLEKIIQDCPDCKGVP